MIRLAALLLVPALLAPVRAEADPSLKPAASVAGEVIRLGDIFANAGTAAGEPVAKAPPPGMHVTFSADWLASAAREHHIAWTPSSNYDQVTVERASRAVGADAIAERILAALAGLATNGPLGDAELQLDNPGLRLMVPAELPDAMVVDGLSLDDRTGRLFAYVSAGSERQRVTAHLIRMTNVAVPARAIAAGEVITAADIQQVRMRRDRISPDIVTTAADLLGRAPRRGLAADLPVHIADIRAPVVIHKGDLVMIVLESPSMRLTAQGKALDDGAQGAPLRVANTKSDRIIDTVVAGAGTVTVAGEAQFAAR
jgi:flagella basal body P-ring formation protein FlgA